MAKAIEKYFTKRKDRSPVSPSEFPASPDAKKVKNLTLSEQSEEDELEHVEQEEAGEDEVFMSELDMSGEVATKLQTILHKLEKLDGIEGSLKKIEASLKSLEQRTEHLEAFHSSAKEDIRGMKESLNNHEQTLEELKMKQTVYEIETAELKVESKEQKNKSDELHMKNLYMEAYSRRENIKFTNIAEETTSAAQREDTEELLRNFLERDLGYADARSVEIQRVHRIGKSKNGAPRPILARFLRYKDCERILSLGQRLKETNFQMFKDLPAEIIEKRRPQVETLKRARRNGIPANFSASQPDKLYVKGKLWPAGKEFIIT